MAVHLGNRCRVMVGDAELRYVREVSISAPADGLVTMTLTIIGGFNYDGNGVFRLSAIEPSKLDVARGISFSGVPSLGD